MIRVSQNWTNSFLIIQVHSANRVIVRQNVLVNLLAEMDLVDFEVVGKRSYCAQTFLRMVSFTELGVGYFQP